MTLNDLYDRLEDQNFHGPCAMVAAIAGNDAFVVRKLAKIMQTHDRLGHMPYELTQERYGLVKDFYKLLPEAGTVESVTAQNEYFGRLLAAIVAEDYPKIISIGMDY
jgi:hypothetical protein